MAMSDLILPRYPWTLIKNVQDIMSFLSPEKCLILIITPLFLKKVTFAQKPQMKINSLTVLRIIFILKRIWIRILNPDWKKNSNFCSRFFILKLDEPFQKWGNFYNLSFFRSLDFDFRSKKGLFCSFWLIFYPLDPNPWIRIFVDPDPGSQNLADLDPKHWVIHIYEKSAFLF